MKYLLTFALTIGLIYGAFVSTSSALPIYGDPSTGSTEGIGSFTGDFTYNASSDTSATLSVTLKNTTVPSTYGGYIVGFGFNNPGDKIGSASLTVSPYPGPNSSPTPSKDFGLALTSDGIDADPFGNFDIASILGGGTALTGAGGNPNGGIAIGYDRTFTFELTGTSLDSLNEYSFFNTLSTGGNKAAPFLVRFKGLAEPPTAGSDKVPGVPGAQVPEPSTVLLLGIGLLGIVGLGRHKLRK